MMGSSAWALVVLKLPTSYSQAAVEGLLQHVKDGVNTDGVSVVALPEDVDLDVVEVMVPRSPVRPD